MRKTAKRIVNDDNEEDDDYLEELRRRREEENARTEEERAQQQHPINDHHKERVTANDHPANLKAFETHDRNDNEPGDIIFTSQFMITVNSQQPAYVNGGTLKNPDYDDICSALQDSMQIITDNPEILARCGRIVPDWVGKFHSDGVDPNAFPEFPDQYILDHQGDYGIHEGKVGSRGGRLHLHGELTITHYKRYFLSYDSLRNEIEALIGNHRWFNGIYLHIRFIPDLHHYIHHERH